MFKEQFLGRNPSHFRVNPVVKAFIISEIFVWSSWYLIIPIFSVLVATKIEGGNIQLAASAISSNLIARVIFEIIIGKFLIGERRKYQFHVIILGLLILSVSYIGLAFSREIISIFIFIIIAGMGVGVAAPAKSAIFSTHLDHDKEPYEWGVHDAFVLIGMAFATALGGFIVSQYGFSSLLILAAIINSVGILPYFLYKSYFSYKPA